MMNRVLLLILIGISGPANAQGRIDSLLKKLPVASAAGRFEVLYALGYEYMDVNDSLGLVYTTQASALADASKDSVKIMRIGRIHGQLLNRLSRHKEGIAVLRGILPSLRKANNVKELTKVYTSLAMAYVFLSDFTRSLRSSFDALQLAEEQHDMVMTSAIYNNIGLVYYKLNNPVKAREYYQRCLDMKIAGDDNTLLDRLYINTGLTYVQSKQYEEAEQFVRKGLGICSGHCTDAVVIEGNNALGMALAGQARYADAERYIRESLSLSEKTGNTRMIIDNLETLSGISIRTNDVRTALASLTRGVALCQEYQYDVPLLQMYSHFIALYEGLADYAKMNRYQALYIDLQKKIFDNKLSSDIAGFEGELEEYRYLQTIENQQKMMRAQEVLLRREKYLAWAIAGIIVLLVLIGLLLYRRNIKRRMLNNTLEQQVMERTRELGDQYAAMTRSYTELRLETEQRERALREHLATLKGLSHLGEMHSDEEQTRGRFSAFRQVAEGLLSGLKNNGSL